MAHQAIQQDEEVSSRNINWQTRYLKVMEELQDKAKECEKLKKENDALKKINKRLAEQNSQLLSKLKKISVEDNHDKTKDEDADSQTWSSTSEQKEQVMADAQLQSSRQSLDQLVIEEDWKTGYLKKEQELEKLKAMSDKLTKCYIDLSLDNYNLKERNKELEKDKDKEDGPTKHEEKYAERAEETDDVADNNTQVAIFPSVFQSDSEPNFAFVNPFNCPASCVLSVIFFVFNEMKLKICFRTFLVGMRVKLGEIPGSKFEIGKCNLSLEDLHCLGLIEKNPVFFKEDINGIDEIDEIDQIDHALQEAIIKLEEHSYSALLAVQYTTKKTGHCMAIMHKRDDSNPTVLMEIYDVQKGQYWPNCDKHAKSIKQIAVYSVNKAVAKEWEGNCGVKTCEAECLVCIPVKEVGHTNAVLDGV